MASVFEIFSCVLEIKRKSKTEIKRNIRAAAKGEKSAIFIGQIRATTPKTKVEVIATHPIRFPRIIPG